MPFLEFKNISKRFPGVLALDHVSFAIDHGGCHALIGENGAGKSTLGKILAGVYTADEGEIQLDGKPIHPANPLIARHLGIAMVHQELAFCPNLTVAENLCLGDLPERAGWVDRTQMTAKARAMLDEIEADIDIEEQIGRLTTGQEQMVQIAATNPDRVIHQMVGRQIVSQTLRHLDQPLGEEMLRVENLSSPGKFSDVTFTLRAGEILGFAGLIGAGRSELAQAIFGLDPLA